MSKTVEEDAGANEFLERRRAALERFIKRCAQHPVILQVSSLIFDSKNETRKEKFV